MDFHGDKLMPLYDFKCDKCGKIVEEFFKIADDKYIKCCGIQMEQVILSAPGLSDPGGIGQKWTNDGYQMRDEKSGNLRTVTEKWERGKNVIRSDVHKSDPIPKNLVRDSKMPMGTGRASMSKTPINDKEFKLS